MQEENIKNLSGKVVVDASFVLAYLLPDEKNQWVTNFFDLYAQRKFSLISSYLLPFEVFNSLKIALKRKRVDLKTSIELIKDYFKLHITCLEINYLDVFRLALKKSLTFYDASYLFVSKDSQAKLLTLDKELLKVS